jgi:3-deoxy-manno-octulosonate cytidylyltransferase (CMP-KDO synthetase)
MRVAIVIPARFQSRRFPGKPLVELRGASGAAKSLLRRSWEAARAAPGAPRALVATDDARIAAHAASFGAEALMTSEACANGTERCAEALSALAARGEAPDLVVNLQGDAPLTPPAFVGALIEAMAGDPEAELATPVLRCDAEALERFRQDRRAGRVGATTAAFDRRGRALYFSKEIIPWADEAPPEAVFHHVGLYAYRPAALAAYPSWPTGPLERIEGLEQLRFLEQGRPVRCVEVEAPGRAFWELNNPVDVERVEAGLRAAGID